MHLELLRSLRWKFLGLLLIVLNLMWRLLPIMLVIKGMNRFRLWLPLIKRYSFCYFLLFNVFNHKFTNFWSDFLLFLIQIFIGVIKIELIDEIKLFEVWRLLVQVNLFKILGKLFLVLVILGIDFLLRRYFCELLLLARYRL